MDDELAAALSRIPQLQGVPHADIACERLGGLTNRNCKLRVGEASYVLRIAGAGTGEYIDRGVEEHTARVAARADGGAEVLFFDAGDGLMLTRFLEGCVTMSPEAFRSRPGAPGRAARAFKRMHEWPEPFRFRFELFNMIDEYLGVLERLGATLPDGYHDVVGEAQAVRKVLADNPGGLAPCHCDPLAENFLDNGDRMWVVDWEYSGMNDPLWDLGDVSVEAGFDEEQDREMLEAYCGGPPSPAVHGRVVVYKAMCDLLWTLWGLIQHANDNPADDFWAYSINRFERCKALMGNDEFGRHLTAVHANR
jgi:thiamine kinase-like enzyme